MNPDPNYPPQPDSSNIPIEPNPQPRPQSIEPAIPQPPPSSTVPMEVFQPQSPVSTSPPPPTSPNPEMLMAQPNESSPIAPYPNPATSSPQPLVSQPDPPILPTKPAPPNPTPLSTPPPIQPTITGIPPQFGQTNTPHLPADGSPPVVATPPVGYAHPKSKLKKLIFILLGVLILAGGATAAGYYGWYIPNKPENVWTASFKQSGQLINKLAAENSAAEAFKSVDFKSDADFRADDYYGKADLSMKYTKQNFDGDLKFGLSVKGQDRAVNIKFLSSLADGATYPDSYFKVTGIKDLGLDSYAPGLSSLEDKWISVEAKYLESLAGPDSTSKPDKPKDPVTSQDVAELSKQIMTTSSDYFLTDNQDKAIIVRKDFIAQEGSGSEIKTNHYTAAIDKGHFKSYCHEVTGKIIDSAAYKKTFTDIPADAKTKENDTCDLEIDKAIKDSYTFDLWIDRKTKLIQKMRFVDQDNAKNYLEISQDYKSGDVFPVNLKVHDETSKTDFIVTFKFNVKAQTTEGKANLTSTADNKYEASGSFAIKPYDGEVKVEKPSPVIPIQTVIDQLNKR